MKTAAKPENERPEGAAREEEIVVGRVTAAHGVKGWIRVYSYTDPVEQIFSYRPWRLVKNGGRVLDIADSRLQGKRLIALPEGFEERDQAESLVGAEIRIGKDQLPALEEGEYYWHELEGLTVVNESGEVFGKVDHLTETGANDVLVVEATAESIDGSQRLIPWVPGRIVTGVDLDSKRITVRWDSDF